MWLFVLEYWRTYTDMENRPMYAAIKASNGPGHGLSIVDGRPFSGIHDDWDVTRQRVKLSKDTIIELLDNKSLHL